MTLKVRLFFRVIVVATIFASVGLGTKVGFAQFGGGQFSYTPSSVEWMTDSADVVVRATVTELTYKDHAPDASQLRSNWQWATVTLRVNAAFKGRPPNTIVLITDQLRKEQTLSRWKATSQPVLWFLVDLRKRRDELPEDFPTEPQAKWRPFDQRMELGATKTGRVDHPVFSMDLQLLDTEAKILDVVQTEVARRRRGEFRSIRIPIPYELAVRSGRAGDVNELEIPVTEHLERLARDWVGSKEDWIRRAGVQALAEFKSPANAAILTNLLNDKASWIEHHDESRERVYYVRESAWKTLQEWKVPVRVRPVLREPPPDRGRPSS